MERVNKILDHDLFQLFLEKNRVAEEDRRFCHHDMNHFLDVARLAMILCLQDCCAAGGDFKYEKNFGNSSAHLLCASELVPAFFAKHLCLARHGHKFGQSDTEYERNIPYGEISQELIYAAALLHDIGRWKQYGDGTPHEEASAQFASEILSDCGFTENETAQIVTAISNHRNEAVREERTLSGILYRADKMSRSCFCCEMERECDWKGSRKNLILRY